MAIKLLDENTINKIAAGEVIENPSNIVKELVENSIDSGAKNIEISIIDGGCKLIKVTDDGSGFEKDDIKLAFLKHATSKLTHLEDIYNIGSYGFRGEALSSIAAVSKTTLITKRKNDNVGYSYRIEYGKEISFSGSASNDGTTIIVENLFDNVPVRKKFLKNESREAANVEDIVIKFSYTKPDISFKFSINNQVKFKTNGDGDLKNVIYTVYGKEIYDSLIEVSDEIRGIKVNGFIAKPIVARNNRNDIVYFVNNRYVKSDVVTRGIVDAYAEYLMQHKFPLVILRLDIDSTFVDVNVHPKKLEVRFSNDDVVYFAVYNAINKVLKNSTLIHEEKIFDNSDEIALPDKEEHICKNDDYENKSLNAESLPSLSDILNAKSSTGYNLNNLFDKFSDKKSELNSTTEKSFIQKTLSEDHKYIGQIFDTYILVEFDEKLYIIDQHAAHEKINYETLMKAYKENKISSEKIFPSIMLRLTPLQYVAVEKNIDEFKKLGYEIELFGDNDIKVDAVPYNIVNIGRKELLLEMIDGFASDANKDEYISMIDRIASISCKKAIKAGRILSEIEVKSLLRELFKLENPYNCPHGRPTIISLSKNEFEKKFGRIV